ncbi:beta-alanine-activating enzyme beta-propeller domain-containing protein [Streptomyces sp. NPDC005146]
MLVIPEFTFGVRVDAPELTLSDEHTEYGWFGLDAAVKAVQWGVASGCDLRARAGRFSEAGVGARISPDSGFPPADGLRVWDRRCSLATPGRAEGIGVETSGRGLSVAVQVSDGHCEFVTSVDRGGTGEAGRGLDCVIGRGASLKVLPHDQGDGSGAETALHQARIIRSLDHAGVVNVPDALRGPAAAARGPRRLPVPALDASPRPGQITRRAALRFSIGAAATAGAGFTAVACSSGDIGGGARASGGGEVSRPRPWRCTTGSGVQSSPTVVDGKVYIGGDDKNVYALDATTGARTWVFATGDTVRSTPAVVDGVVYVGSYDGNLYALDAATGAKKWAFTTRGGVHSSPRVVGGVVYVGSRVGVVFALDAATGSTKWDFVTGGYLFSSAAVVDGVVYIGALNKNVYALDAATGAKKWAFATRGEVHSSPAVVGGVVYVGSYDESLYALDAATGAKKWAFATGGWVSSSATVVDGVLYVGSDRYVYALDAATGAKKWDFTTRGVIMHSSPAVVDGVVYIGSSDRYVYALDAATGAKKWDFTTRGEVFSSPAVAGGVLYIGSNDENVYALDAVTGGGPDLPPSPSPYQPPVPLPQPSGDGAGSSTT